MDKTHIHQANDEYRRLERTIADATTTINELVSERDAYREARDIAQQSAAMWRRNRKAL